MSSLELISFSFNKGGAGIAAGKFLKIVSNEKSAYQVDQINQNNSNIYQYIKRVISYGLNKLQFDGNETKHSLNLFSYKPVIESFIKNHHKIHHLHWINNDTLSVFDLHKIPSGSIVTLHDEWLYCGSEHYYKVQDNSNDFISGYRYFKNNVSGIHWNALIWKIKRQKLAHRKDLIYTVPSTWMLKRAKESAILKNSDIRLMPNPVDTDIFRPSPENQKKSLRVSLNIKTTSFLVVYGAIAGSKNKLKGIDQLKKSLEILRSKCDDLNKKEIVLVDIGGSIGEDKLCGFRSISLGYIDDRNYLSNLFSSADCVIVPSLLEAFGQIAAEALSCSTPVISFDTSGLRDLVIHERTGLVAKEHSSVALCDQLLAIMNLTHDDRLRMGQNGRNHILEKFSFPVISEIYQNIILDAINLKNKSKLKN